MAFAVRDEVFYVHISSDGCLAEFPKNSPSDFSVRLRNRKELSNPRRGWTVGLGDMYYSTEIRNMGRNCDTYLKFLRGGRYRTINMIDAVAKSAREVIELINSAIAQFDKVYLAEIAVEEERRKAAVVETGVHAAEEHAMETNQIVVSGSVEEAEKLADGVKGDEMYARPLADSLVFETNEGREALKIHEPVVIKVSYLDDFGISYMLRKLLGVVGEKTKVWVERFSRRRVYRTFLLRHAEMSVHFFLRSVCPKLDEELFKFGSSNSYWKGGDALFEKRNEVLGRYGLNIEVFCRSFQRLGLGHFDEVLASLIEEDAAEFARFLSFRYPRGQHGVVFNNVELGSFANYAMLEFVLCEVVHNSVRELEGKKFVIRENVSFCPHVFDQFFVYLNVVEEESFNDQMVRLLDIVPVKRVSVVGIDNKPLRTESVHFQSTRRKVLAVSSLDVLHVSLRTVLGKPVPFVGGMVLLSLEFLKIK